MLLLLSACRPCGVEAGEDCEMAPLDFEGEPVDTTVPAGEAELYAVAESGAYGLWYYAYDLSVQPSAGELLVSGPDGFGGRREEVHPLDVSPGSHWQLEGWLAVVPDPDDWIAGATSAFVCDAADLTRRLFVFEADGARTCFVWGVDSALVTVDGCVER
jgi:hypothetical protein